MPLSPNTRLGRYQILSSLGAGGMGEVYLAHDIRLDRTVALKILPAEVASDQKRMQRFIQEARSASALNHPNIITIHEIEETDSTHFIATEFIDGKTLRATMARERMKIDEVLDVSIQVASALAAAHEAGIIHRDIKPENIMIRRDRLVKVLDFGLAKLTEPRQTVTIDTSAPTKVLVNTEPGTVMGTAQYMSPEQTRGLETDVRTDIWSLGCLLYEMVAGRLPFAGQTTSDLIAAILKTEPPPLSTCAPEAPAELGHIVRKALRKDREARYQTSKDLLLDLQDLKEELGFQAKMERSIQPPLREQAEIAHEGEPEAGQQTRQREAAPTDAEATARPTSSAVHLVSKIKRHKLGAALLVALLLAGVAAIIYYFSSARGDKAAITSVAVLPFVNASNDPNTEYLSDGISESLINALSQLPRLRVMARTTVFRYKGREADPQQVGRELGVQAILTGKVLQRGDTLIVQAELVNVSDGTQLWGEKYSQKLSDIFVIQEAIARQISEKLRVRLTGEEQQRATKRETESVAAYQFYLRGRFEWNKFTPDGLTKSVDYYNQAIALDPTYALAYIGLAESYGVQAQIGICPSKECYPQAKRAAEKALALDDNLAEAHVVIAEINLFYEWDWTVAEREIKRALELNPNNADAHLTYSTYLKTMGRHTEEIAEAKRAQELDPLSLIANMELAEAFYMAREYDEAIKQSQKTLELDRNFMLTYHVLARALEQKGMYAEAITQYQQALNIFRNDPTLLASLGHIYAMAGRRDEAQKVLAELQAMSTQRYIPPYLIAKVYAGLGDKDQAFTWLERAFEDRYFLLVWLGSEPQFDSLRSDPRYTDLMRRIGL
jgi:serine/threonine protein kinase/Tfp pilus assembly protein PilF